MILLNTENSFWIWLSTLVPDCVSPCTITMTGLFINLTSCLTVLYYASDLKSEAPSWTFALCAIGLFLYQTLDALDGKQCFKVQNTSLEEVYDHMCDAISSVFVALAIGAAAQLAHHPFILYSFFLLSVIAFYSTHWTCHVTHTMVFGRVDVSEAQVAMIAAHAVTAYFGQRVWQTTLVSALNYDITLIHLLAFVSLSSLIKSLVENVRMAGLGCKTPLEERGISIPRRKSCLRPLIPLILLVILSHACYLTDLMSVSPTVFLLTLGFCFAKLTMSLVMANVSKGDMELLDGCMAVPLLLFLNESVCPLVSSYTALLCALVYCVMDVIRFFTYASWDLRHAHDVHIFSIKYPVGHEKNKRGDAGFYFNGLNGDKVLKAWQDFVRDKGQDLDQCFAAEP